MDVEQKVKLFLFQFREYVEGGKCEFWKHRKKNSDLLRNLGWTINVMFSYLVEELEVQDYLSGPSPDHDGSEGDVWEFGKTIESIDVYVKIKINPDSSLCMSFHEKQKEFRFPLRNR